MTTTEILSAALRGEVLQPADAGYDRARRIWNAAHDRRPGVVVRARVPEDVAAALRFARRHALEVAVRGGAVGRVRRGGAGPRAGGDGR